MSGGRHETPALSRRSELVGASVWPPSAAPAPPAEHAGGVLGALLAGVVFALGLALSGMTLPSRVLAFLDVTGAFDPSLAFVMAGAVATYALGSRLVLRRERPVFAPMFDRAPPRRVDARLVTGAVAFGVAWGVVGICPGPGLVLALGDASMLTFAVAMVAGVLVGERFLKR